MALGALSTNTSLKIFPSSSSSFPSLSFPFPNFPNGPNNINVLKGDSMAMGSDSVAL